MLLFPKNTKYKKYHSYLPDFYERETKSIDLIYGSVGLKVIQSGHISAKQLEACRRIIIRSIRKSKGSKLWFCVFPFHSTTKKPKEVRMGKGKGSHHEWVVTIKAGKMLFELKDMSKNLAIKTFNHVLTKLPLKSIVVIND